MKLTTTVVLSKIRFKQHVQIEIIKRERERQREREKQRDNRSWNKMNANAQNKEIY